MAFEGIEARGDLAVDASIYVVEGLSSAHTGFASDVCSLKNDKGEL
jgi:hypothetical protein